MIHPQFPWTGGRAYLIDELPFSERLPPNVCLPPLLSLFVSFSRSNTTLHFDRFLLSFYNLQISTTLFSKSNQFLLTPENAVICKRKHVNFNFKNEISYFKIAAIVPKLERTVNNCERYLSRK